MFNSVMMTWAKMTVSEPTSQEGVLDHVNYEHCSGHYAALWKQV